LNRPLQAQTFPMTWEEAVQWLREQPGQESLVRACYFDDPLLEAAKRYREEAEWQCVKKLLGTPPGMALDMGSGRGIAAFALAADGWTVTALEPNSSRLVGTGAIRSLARDAGVHIQIVEEAGEDLPFADASYDVIHARQVLHHAHDLRLLCKELHRVAKPRARMVATREHVVDRPDDLQAFLDSHPLHHLYGGENAYSLDEYQSALRDAGFIVTKVLSPYETPINYFPMTYDAVQKAVSASLHWPLPRALPDFVIRAVSRLLTAPGRLYTFVCERRK
jgi:SAM-dependent methyltransferase